MPNLKTYLDAAIAADDEVKRIVNEIDAYFSDGTDEGKKKALELRPALDEAKNKSLDANKLYISMRDASLTQSDASLFSAPADPENNQGDKTPKIVNREVLRNMSPAERMNHIRSGGKVTE